MNKKSVLTKEERGRIVKTCRFTYSQMVGAGSKVYDHHGMELSEQKMIEEVLKNAKSSKLEKRRAP